MIFKLEGVSIRINAEPKGLRLQTDFTNVLLLNQRWAEVKPLLVNNATIVKDFFFKNRQHLTESDCSAIILKIVLEHLCLYSNWREIYPKEKDRDLVFATKDLTTPMTYDIVIDYLKAKDHKNYQSLSAKFLGLTEAELIAHETARAKHMDR